MADRERAWLNGEIERAMASLLDTLITSRGWSVNKENRTLAMAASVGTLAAKEGGKGCDIHSIIYTTAQCDRMVEQAVQLDRLCRQLVSVRTVESPDIQVS